MIANRERDGEAHEAHIVIDHVALAGSLHVPKGALGIALFAHGNGSSRHSPRNRFVAQALVRAGLATLLMDLLTPDEEAIDERTRHLRFNIELLAERLTGAVDWLKANATTRHLNIGLFGASTGAAAALFTAAARSAAVQAVVSRGGRPDLAAPVLGQVKAPTLLIVGSEDHVVLDLNRQAFAELPDVNGANELEVVAGATHLFEEPGALEQVAQLAANWFQRHLASGEPSM